MTIEMYESVPAKEEKRAPVNGAPMKIKGSAGFLELELQSHLGVE